MMSQSNVHTAPPWPCLSVFHIVQSPDMVSSREAMVDRWINFQAKINYFIFVECIPLKMTNRKYYVQFIHNILRTLNLEFKTQSFFIEKKNVLMKEKNNDCDWWVHDETKLSVNSIKVMRQLLYLLYQKPELLFCSPLTWWAVTWQSWYRSQCNGIIVYS